MARYCGASLWSDGDRRCSSKWQETETETPVPVKRRGFKSCWRGIEGGKKKKKKIQGFHRKRNTRFPSSFSFPSPHLIPLPPSLLPRCWQDWERIANSSIFERGDRDKGKLGENEAVVDEARAEREIYTHRYWPIPRPPMLSSTFLSSRLISARGDESSLPSPSTTIRLSLVPHLV